MVYMKYLLTINNELSGSPLVCNAVDLRSATVRSLELHAPVDRVSTFYIHSEAISQGIDANVDIYCKSCDVMVAGTYCNEWLFVICIIMDSYELNLKLHFDLIASAMK